MAGVTSERAQMRRPNDRDGGDALDPLLRGEVAFRLLVDAVQDYAIFLLSTTGRVLTWNLGAERIKGYAAHEIIGRHFSAFYTPEEREAGRPMMLLGLAAEEGRFEDEGWRVRKDGTRFWADVIITALRDDSGVPYAYAKVTRDLTERRASEERRRQLLAEQRARSAAEEALAARDRFLSIASHELKTPIASLRLSAEALLHAKDAGLLDQDRLETGLDRILTASNRLGELVAELLDISGLIAGALPTHREPTDIVGLASDVLARYADAGVGDRIRLSAPSPVIAEVDASRIDQVLTNLVDNALKYSEPPDEIVVAVTGLPDAAEITISDHGIGIDEVTAKRMFDAFGRGDSVEHVPGLGLGLHISHQVVERHGGSITAAPRADGPGTTFTVRLPRIFQAEA
jgi:PAS domain S-box-containing protein